MKKYLFTLLFLLPFGFALSAQTAQEEFSESLNPSMKRLFRGYGELVTGVKQKNTFKVGKAAETLNMDSIKNEGLTIGYLKVTPVDVEALMPNTDGFDFTSKYARLWIDTNGEGPFLEKAEGLRGFPGEAKLLPIRISPNSSVSYEVSLKNNCKIYAYYEPDTDVTLSLSSPVVEIPMQRNEDENLWFASWTMPQKDKVELVIRNNSDRPSSVILVSD